MSRKASRFSIKVGDDQRSRNDRVGKSGSVEAWRKVGGAVVGIDAKQEVGSNCITNKDDIDHVLIAIGKLLHEQERIEGIRLQPLFL